MQEEISYLEINLNLPDHSQQLHEAEQYVNNIKQKLKECTNNKQISLKTYEILYDKITRALLYVGTLSMPVFNVEEKIENTYLETYKHAPELGKKLWLEHYGQIHHPYNILKNRLFRLFDQLDELYIKLNRKHPPQL